VRCDGYKRYKGKGYRGIGYKGIGVCLLFEVRLHGCRTSLAG
jgi:hypothetical protein